MRRAIFLFPIFLVLISCVEETVSSNVEEVLIESDYPLSEIEVPSEGLLGEYITLSANNLQANKLRFLFDDVIADAYQFNTDTVKVEVPRGLTSVNSEISVLVQANDSLVHTSGFQLRAPQISGVEKTIVEFNEEVWIYGENFDIDYSYMDVKINGLDVGVNETTRDSIQVTIPTNLTSPLMDVYVSAQLQEVTATELMTLKTPEITSTDEVVNVGGLMQIQGVNFNPNTENGTFTINDEIEAYLVSVTGNHTATLRVPYGPYEDFEIYKVSYETLGLQTELNTIIIIDSDYILYTKNNITPSTNLRHYNSKTYTFVNDEEDAEGIPVHHLYELDYTTRAWTKINSVSVTGYGLTETLTDLGELYVFVSEYNATGNIFYKVDLNNFTLSDVSAPSYNPLRVSPAFFHFNNKIYYGKGRSGYGISDIYYVDLYSFDIANQSWNSLTSDGSQFYSSSDYDFQGGKFVQTYTIQSFAEYVLQEFNPVNNSFTEVVPISTYETYNVFNYEDKLLRVTIIPSTDTSYFYPYNNADLLTTLNIQQLEGTSRYYARGSQVFFYSSVMNDAYSPSNGFYLLHPSISGQL